MKSKILFILCLFVECLISTITNADTLDGVVKKETTIVTETSNIVNASEVPNNDIMEQLMQTITIDELKEKADKGDTQSQLDLGYMFLYGKNGANIDYKQAIHYYELAAKSNNPTALNNMGSLYFSGIGTEVDQTKAIYYFEEAAKYGSNDAAINLAIIYLGDTKKEKTLDDWKKIYSLLNKAQETNVFAKYLLGYSYRVGFLVKKNFKKSFQLIKYAADDNYDEAQYILSEFYISGSGTVKNYNNAVKYLKLSS